MSDEIKMIEHVVMNKDFATTLIKEGWTLKGIRPNIKKGCGNQSVFVFNVTEEDEEKFDNRMTELKDELAKEKAKVKERENIEKLAQEKLIEVGSTNNQVVNFNFDEDKFIDKLVKEFVPVLMAYLVDLEKKFKPMFDRVINVIESNKSMNLDNIHINANDLGDVGRELLKAKNNKK